MADTEKKDSTKTSDAAQKKVTRPAKAEKKKWDLARCRKIANRFKSELEWSVGAPSSYKSAKAHGWVEEILGQIASRRNAGTPTRTKKAA